MYVTQDQIKKYLGINWSSSLDTFIDTLITATTDYVERFCGDERYGKRVFEAPDPDSDVIKYFNGNGEQRLYIGDCRSITTLVVDSDTLVANTDFYLYPLNASTEDVPFTAIELVQPETAFANSNPRSSRTNPYIFEELQRSVVVTGKWGYSASAPDSIVLAMLKLIGGVIKENIGDSDLREVTQETLGEYSTSYAKIKDIAHMIGVDDILMPYKRQRNGKNKLFQVS